MRGAAYATCPQPHAGDAIEITVISDEGYLARTSLEPIEAMKLARHLHRFAVERTRADHGIQEEEFSGGLL